MYHDKDKDKEDRYKESKDKEKNNAEGKQTKNREFGPCQWRGRDGHLAADC